MHLEHSGTVTKTNSDTDEHNKLSDAGSPHKRSTSNPICPTIPPQRKLILGTETYMFRCIGLLIVYLTWGLCKNV